MKVLVLPYQPHCFAFGGFEIQMIAVLDAVRSVGGDVARMDVWERDASFDILHVWGLGEAHRPAMYWARRTGKAVVMTALLPYLSRAQHVKERLLSQLPSRRAVRNLSAMVDVLVVVNEETAQSAERLLGLPAERIRIVPHVVDRTFFELADDADRVDFGIDGFIFCAGNICARKNQVALAEAAAATGTPILFMGDVLPGEEDVGAALSCLVEGHDAIRWERNVAHTSRRLPAAFRQCAGFALPSFHETQPISALEAVAARKPLLLANRPYARQKYYTSALLVDPSNRTSLRDGLARLRSAPAAYTPAATVIEDCRPERVGAAYVEVYGQARAIAASRESL